jgi:serine/threonine protein phosphatase PrpC
MAFVIPKDSQVMASKGALFIVADGMGGHAAGEVASEIAVDTVSNMYYQEDSNDVAVSLLRAIRRANVSIHQRAAENLLRTGMGTTCVAAVLRGNMAYIANVGDSRAYLLRGNQVKQISQDHSWVAEQVRAGLLTEEQARTHAQRNVITRCLGTQAEVDVDVFHEELHEGDCMVLCTDGLSGLVNDEELQRIVDQFVPQESVYHLVERANENGGPDNITAIVVRVQEIGEEPPGIRYPVVVGGREIGEDTVTLGMLSDSPLGAGSGNGTNGNIGISSGPLRLSSGPLMLSPNSITASQPAIGKHQSGRRRLFYPILAVIALLVIILFGGGALYFLRSNESQAANQALDAAQQQIMNVTSASPVSALNTLATTQKTLVDVQKKYQLNDAQMQRLTQLQNDLVGHVQIAISDYNQQAKINVLPCNSTSHPIDNTSSNTSPGSIAFADGFTSNPFLYTLGLDNRLYQINSQYGMESPLPNGKTIPQFSNIASNGSLLFLIEKQGNGNSQATYKLSVYQPGQQGALSVPISSAQIGANFTNNGYVPLFITAWNNTVHVVLSSQTDQGNPHILSYVLDTKEHLSRPKESQISISAPLVSIAAFPSQLFLLLSSGDVQSLSLMNGSQLSSLPMPVLAESQIAPPLVATAKDYKATTAVPTVTTVDPSGSTALSIPSMSQTNPAMLTAGQINGVPHLYIGDPANHRVLNLESSPGGLTTPTTGTNNSVKLQLDQQYVSYTDFKQVKSLAVDRQGDQLSALSQIPPSTANLVSIQTGTQNGVLDHCPA